MTPLASLPVLLVGKPDVRGLDQMGISLRQLGVDVLRVDDMGAASALTNQVSGVILAARRGKVGNDLGAVRRMNARVPIHLIDDDTDVTGLAEKVGADARAYVETAMPPFFKALVGHVEQGSTSWHAPGHTGGAAFLKSPTGKLFRDFFGVNMLRADVCNAVEGLGQLLEHSGPVGEAEDNAARIFGADHLFFVTNGTSTSNKIVWTATIGAGDVVVVDRNCHKSVLHSLILTGAIPVFLRPTRNLDGVIGPVPRSELDPATIRARVDAHPLIKERDRPIRMLSLTQSTYDGILYNAEAIKAAFDGQIASLHFDEAWMPHAGFHEFYRGMHALGNEATRCRDSVLFVTQSTHKVLGGISQASQILVRDAQVQRFDRELFDEAYLMHTSTSPQYAIIASCDVSAAMMDGPAGRGLVQEALVEALEFRRAVIARGERYGSSWWFSVWGPDTPPRTGIGDRVDWDLTPDQTWHGFDGVDVGHAMLDPTKVTVRTPGLDLATGLQKDGIPAVVVTQYLAEHGAVVEKTGLYSFLLLFTIGATRSAWNALLSQLEAFKAAHDRNELIASVMPAFATRQPALRELGLRDVCQGIHELHRHHDVALRTRDVYTAEVAAAMLPADAWSQAVHGGLEPVAVGELEGRTAAAVLTPYPPGIPLLIPGERFNRPIEDFLAFVETFARQYPGLAPSVHGLQTMGEGGALRMSVNCLTR